MSSLDLPMAHKFQQSTNLNADLAQFLDSDVEIPYKQMQAIILAIIARHEEVSEPMMKRFIEFLNTIDFKQPLLLAPFYLHYLPHHNLGLLVLYPLVKLVVEKNLSDVNGVQIFPSLYKLLNCQVLEKFKQKTLIAKLLLNSPLADAQVAAFLKKFARLAVLSSENSLVCFLIGMIYSLAQKYPKLKPLFHDESEIEELFESDPFDLAAPIEEAKVVSLWEISLLLRHANPTVHRLASFFKTNFFARDARKIDAVDFVALDETLLFAKERAVKGDLQFGYEGDGNEEIIQLTELCWL